MGNDCQKCCVCLRNNDSVPLLLSKETCLLRICVNSNNDVEEDNICDQKQTKDDEEEHSEKQQQKEDNISNSNSNSNSYRRKRRRTSSPSSSSIDTSSGSNFGIAEVNGIDNFINNNDIQIDDIDNKCNNNNGEKKEELSESRLVMGVSLPWFERGGPKYRRPISLIDDNDEEKRQQRRRKQQFISSTSSSTLTAGPNVDETATTTRASMPNVPSHFAGLPIPVKRIGVCEECGIMAGSKERGGAELDSEDVIVLCDGIGCEREFHLRCCRPPLQQIPQQDEYYCFDCHPKGGSTELLVEYFDEIECDRESHNEKYCTSEFKFEQPWYQQQQQQHRNNNIYNDKYVESLAITSSHPAATSSPPKLSTTTRKRKPHSRQSQNKLNHRSDKIDMIKDHNSNISNSNSEQLTFADKLILVDIKENQPEWLLEGQELNGHGGITNSSRGPPRSELEMFHCRQRLQHKQQHTHKVGGKEERNNDHSDNINGNINVNDSNKEVDNNEDDPSDALVGSAIRLYCPKTNQYHTGRILRVRKKGSEEEEEEMNSSIDYHDTECLIRFQAGRDYRKTSLTRWIRLEEHSLAVASSNLVVAKFDNDVHSVGCGTKRRGRRSRQQQQKRSSYRWMPAKLWMRSSRELVMSMQLLEEELGQIKYRKWRYHYHSRQASSQQKYRRQSEGNILDDGDDMLETVGTAVTKPPSVSISTKLGLQQEWILAECIGRGIYKLVQVSMETKEGGMFDTPATATATATAVKKTNNNRIKRRNSEFAAASDGINQREDQIMYALKLAEREEQFRVRQWNDLPLENKWHNNALTCQDEVAIGPLTYSSYVGNNGSEIDDDYEKNKTTVIEPTPLVRVGLDRMYIMDEFVKQYNRNNINLYSVHTSNGNIESGISKGRSAGVRGSKDLAISMSCDLVFNHSITACIQEQNSRERSNQRQLEQRWQTEAQKKPIEEEEAKKNVQEERKQSESEAQAKLEVQRKYKKEAAAANSTIEAVEASKKANEKKERIHLESKKEAEEGEIMQEKADSKVNGRERVTQDERKKSEAEAQSKVDFEVQRKAGEETAAAKSTIGAEANKKVDEEERIRLESEKEAGEGEIMQEEVNNKIKEIEKKLRDKRKQTEDETQIKAGLEVQRKAKEGAASSKAKTVADNEGERICLESKKEVEEEKILQKESNNKTKDTERMRNKAENISKATTKVVLSSSPIVVSTSTSTITTGVEHPHISKSKRTEVTMEATTLIRVASMVSQNGGTHKVEMGKGANDQEVTITHKPSPSQCLTFPSTGKEAITMTTGVAPDIRLAPFLEEEMLPLQVAQNVSTATNIAESLLQQPILQKETNISTKSAEVSETLLSKETYEVGAPVHTCPST